MPWTSSLTKVVWRGGGGGVPYQAVLQLHGGRRLSVQIIGAEWWIAVEDASCVQPVLGSPWWDVHVCVWLGDLVAVGFIVLSGASGACRLCHRRSGMAYAKLLRWVGQHQNA